MVLDVFGQDQSCIQEMEIDFISRNFLRKIGRRVNLMDNCLLAEGNFHKHCLLLKRILPLTHNGKK